MTHAVTLSRDITDSLLNILRCREVHSVREIEFLALNGHGRSTRICTEDDSRMSRGRAASTQ